MTIFICYEVYIRLFILSFQNTHLQIKIKRYFHAILFLQHTNMINSDQITSTNQTEHYPNWPHIPDQGWIQATSTYANAEVTFSVVKLLKNTGILIFSTKLLTSFLLPIEKIRKS